MVQKNGENQEERRVPLGRASARAPYGGNAGDAAAFHIAPSGPGGTEGGGISPPGSSRPTPAGLRFAPAPFTHTHPPHRAPRPAVRLRPPPRAAPFPRVPRAYSAGAAVKTDTAPGAEAPRSEEGGWRLWRPLAPHSRRRPRRARPAGGPQRPPWPLPRPAPLTKLPPPASATS